MSESILFESDFEAPKFQPKQLGKVIDDEFFIKQAFLEGENKGFELLYNRYYKPLCSHAVRFVYAKDVAEDIISEIFYNIWKNKTFLNITTSFRQFGIKNSRNSALRAKASVSPKAISVCTKFGSNSR